MKKVVVGIGGASGIRLGLRLIEEMQKSTKCHIVLSESAQLVWKKETCKNLLEEIEARGGILYEEKEIWADIASGSFGADMMAIVPTSMNLLAKIACGIGDELISRCASVMIKEKKTLLLAPREMPFSSIALENMLKLSNLGVIISPPILAYYAKIETLEEMENFLIGKWLDVLGIRNELYQRWEGGK